jgi:translocation and assembly module TamB
MRKRIVIATVVLLLLLPVAALFVLLYSQLGVDLIVGQLGRLDRYGMRIEGVSGTLAGPLRVARFELNHPRVHVLVHDIVIYPQIRGLLWQTLQVGAMTGRDVSVELHAVDLPDSGRPLRFLPNFLRIDARNVEFTRARYVHQNGMTLDASRVRGRATMTPLELRVLEAQVDAERFDGQGELTLRAQRPLALEANGSGHVRLENNPELALLAQLSGTIDRLGIKATLQRPSLATADVVLARPDDSWQILGKVASPEFSLAPWLERPPFSLRNVALDVTWKPDEIRARGAVGVPELDSESLEVDAAGRFAERVLHLRSVDVALAGMPARLHTSGTVTFDGGTPTIDATGNWTELQWPLRGDAIVRSASGQAALRGELPYGFNVTAEVAGPRVPHAHGSAAGVVAKEQVTISSYDIQALSGNLSGSGSLRFAAPQAWTLVARAVNVDPAQIRREFPGKLAFALDGRGQGLTTAANFSVTIADLSGTLRNARVRGAGAVERDAKGWRVRDAKVSMGDAQLNLDGTLRDTVDVRWTFASPSLQALLPDARGSLQLSGTASGPRQTPHVVANVRADDLRYGQWTAKHFEIDGDIDLGGKAFSRLSVRGENAGFGQWLMRSLQISGDGTAAEHRLAIDVAAAGTDADSAVPARAEIRADGRFDAGVWNATLHTTNVRAGDSGQRIDIAEPAHLTLARERATLDDFCLAIGNGRLCASGKWQSRGSWEGTVGGYELPLATFLPSAGESTEYEGRIEGRVRVFGAPGTPWQSEAGMRIIDAAIVYRPPGAEPERLNLGTGGLAATATRERIDFSLGVQAFTDTFLYANAHLPRDGSNNVLDLPLTGDIRARAADANILPIVFPDIDDAAGLLTAQANVSGTLRRPQLDGKIELTNGELDSYRVNLALRELNLAARFSGNGLDFEGAGRAGDGRLDVGGTLSWSDGAPQGDLRLRGENLLVADLPEYRVVASPDLVFKIQARRIDAAGEVLVPSARIQPARLQGAVSASDDARYIGEHAAEKAGRYTVHSEVRIVMGDDVQVDTFGLQGRITGGVGTTTHTGEVAVGRGELSVADGRYEAYGQKLEINRGRLLFEASPLNDPGLDIEARRKVETVTVGLNVRGTLQAPRLTFFSDPSMTQMQIVSYLLGGTSGNSFTSSSDDSTLNAARDAALSAGGGLIAAQLGRRLGLEEVGVESSTGKSGQTNQSLVLGKFLSPRLFVSYGISLTESINTLKLRYTITDRWIFKTEAGEEQSADMEYTIER